MFFPKLRRKAKWVFLLIALAFGLSFLVAGVGTGFGSGLGDYLGDLLNRQPGAAGPSVDEARERAEANPEDPEAQLELANAYQIAVRTDEAIAAYERYIELRPNDEQALQSLASLYLLKASEAEQRARTAQVQAARAFFANELRSPESEFGRGLGVDPITSYRQEQASQAFQSSFAEAQASYAKEAAIWQTITELEPEEARFFLELARSSQQAGDSEAAITAYERFVELAPEDSRVEQVREIIKELKKQPQQPTVGGGG